ncbi:hypothetical protein FHS26_006418 [Rhizobium pisi]|uniref:Uncharacterized protein n=1 Tax=Rhizobium pisi TaxID=574561 RepID=A0A7W5BTP4_9HYPH|nr:hypothetical protein [Rhizobium pisi]
MRIGPKRKILSSYCSTLAKNFSTHARLLFHAIAGSMFSMVDAVFVLRYFEFIDPTVTQMIFQGLPRITQWPEALAPRESVVAVSCSSTIWPSTKHS